MMQVVRKNLVRHVAIVGRYYYTRLSVTNIYLNMFGACVARGCRIGYLSEVKKKKSEIKMGKPR